jgi:hypothetical protein
MSRFEAALAPLSEQSGAERQLLLNRSSGFSNNIS